MSKNSKTITKRDIDETISGCLKQYTIVDDKKRNDSEFKFHTKKEYDDSFKSEGILTFSRQIKKQDKTKIDYIIFNTNNMDGLFSAYCCYRYLYIDNKHDDIRFVAIGPYQGKGFDKRLKFDEMRGKNVIICDISYNLETLKKIASSSKSVIIIDDHPATEAKITESNVKKFIGSVHGACAYVWKFFYPTAEVPIIIQAIDIQDRTGINASYIPYAHYIKSAIEFRFHHNQSPNFLKSKFNLESGMFRQLHNVIELNDVSFLISLSMYHEEILENLKTQIAKNARPAIFLKDYKVMYLNYLDPVLMKRVAKQIITNCKEAGIKIDFVILFGYSVVIDEWNIQLTEDHYSGPPKYNLPTLAKQIGDLNSSRGGGGSQYIGNCFLKRSKKLDIWDFFDGKTTLNDMKKRLR